MDILQRQHIRLKRVIKEECQRKYDLIVWEVITNHIKGLEQDETKTGKKDME